MSRKIDVVSSLFLSEFGKLCIFMRTIWYFIFIVYTITGHSQGTYSLSGRLNDSNTGEPIPFANVFLANTLIGSSSKEDGTFFLDKIPVGKYDLTVSMLGYGLFSTPVTVWEK